MASTNEPEFALMAPLLARDPSLPYYQGDTGILGRYSASKLGLWRSTLLGLALAAVVALTFIAGEARGRDLSAPDTFDASSINRTIQHTDQPDSPARLGQLSSTYFSGPNDDEECLSIYGWKGAARWATADIRPICQPGGLSEFKCYLWPEGIHGGKDAFCKGEMVRWGGVPDDHTMPLFQVECQSDNQAMGIVQDLPNYMYETGIPIVLGQLSSVSNAELACSNIWNGYTYFFKREGNGNIFHSIAEVLNFYLTAQALSLAELADRNDSRIVFLDDHSPGIFEPLWRVFSPKTPILFSADVPVGTCFANAIYGIPGGSSTWFWRQLWERSSCSSGKLFHHFVRLLLDGLGNGLSEMKPSAKDEIRVTFVDRTERRRMLENLDEIIEDIEKLDTRVKVQKIDFGNFSLVDQVKFVRQTDILFGVHGAGMTHLLWLPAEASVIEILPSPLVRNYGYRNLAKQLDHPYFSVSGSPTSSDDWANANVTVSREAILEVVKAAVMLSANAGSRGLGVNQMKLLTPA